MDALDEAPDSTTKDDILTILTHLLALCGPHTDMRYQNRFYLTARFSERDRVTGYPDDSGNELFKPVFCVRSLDMEQLRDMARHFYRRQPELYKLFDEVVWREEIARKVGGTPLTALLVIAYF